MLLKTEFLFEMIPPDGLHRLGVLVRIQTLCGQETLGPDLKSFASLRKQVWLLKTLNRQTSWLWPPRTTRFSAIPLTVSGVLLVLLLTLTCANLCSPL